MASISTSAGSGAAGGPPDLSELQPDTLRAEMANIQHSIVLLEKSNGEMRRLLQDAEEEGLDEEDKEELRKALEENVGVRERKEKLHDKVAQVLADLLGVDATHFLLDKSQLDAVIQEQTRGQPGAAPALAATTAATATQTARASAGSREGASAPAADSMEEDAEGVFL